MIEYLKADVRCEEPIFAYVAFLAVHLPVQAPKKYADQYANTYAAGWNAGCHTRLMSAPALGLVGEDAPKSTRTRRTSPACLS
jgi:arylsulfatase/uncharacterized sulfatase